MRGAYGTRIQTQLYLIIVPPDGHQGCHCGETACLYSITWGVGREAQEGSELPARRSRLLRRLSYLILCSEVSTLRIELLPLAGTAVRLVFAGAAAEDA